MTTIWKFELPEIGINKVSIPVGFEILHVGKQEVENDSYRICFWAMVNTDQPAFIKQFTVVGTGWDLSGYKIHNYIATVQIPPYVWHIFENHQ